MLMATINTIIFDLDGTLLDTLSDLSASVNHALGTFGQPLRSDSEVRSYLGNGIRYLMRSAVQPDTPDDVFEEIFACFRTHYVEHCLDRTQPYEGIMSLLKELATRGIRTAIVSNKLQPAVEQLNRRFFGQYIQSAVGESATVRRKPNPDAVMAAMTALHSRREETLYVGDSEVDIETAANAGIRCIGVLWGFRDEAFLREKYPDTTYIRQPSELLHIIDGSTAGGPEMQDSPAQCKS